MKNGLHRTTADEEYQRGLEHGRKARAEGMTADVMERCINHDTQMAKDSNDVFAQFFYGRIDGLSGK